MPLSIIFPSNDFPKKSIVALNNLIERIGIQNNLIPVFSFYELHRAKLLRIRKILLILEGKYSTIVREFLDRLTFALTDNSIVEMTTLPVIDISSLIANDSTRYAESIEASKEIGVACRDTGFFYIKNHGVDADLQMKLEHLSREFFTLDEAEKMKISMSKGGRAWRGYFPLEGELTSGKPDLKKGIYFGSELSADDPRVKRELPLHGANLFPQHPSGLKEVVLQYMDALTQLGHALMKGIALSLDLPPGYFQSRYTADPLVLFRIFHYPAQKPSASQWGVGEHTDYGVLTMLKQDDAGGLQVKSKGSWMDAPPIPNTFICNIGDMLDRMTGGLYRSTPHRVLNKSSRGRMSFPFFFDPNFEAKVHRIENIQSVSDDREQRWDHASVHAFDGTYGDYLLNKVGKVFPELQRKVL